jgi:hypothetical protein
MHLSPPPQTPVRMRVLILLLSMIVEPRAGRRELIVSREA